MTFSRFTVTISGGVIGWHSGLFNGNFQSGLNATQIKFLGACPSPTLNLQPVADFVVNGGQPVNLVMTASNPAGVTGGLSYSWQKAGAATPAGTTPTLALGPAGANHSGVYTGTAFNACGSTSTQAVRVTVLTADIGVQGGLAGQDGLLNNNDFIVFIAGSSPPNPWRTWAPGRRRRQDGLFNNNDFVVFINQFFTGCGVG